MAYTDDIAEKVASILFESLLRSANYVTDVGPNVINALGAGGKSAFAGVTRLASKLAKDQESARILAGEGRISVAQFNEAVNHLKERTRTIRISDNDAKIFDQLLAKEKVLHARIDMKDDDCSMYMYLDQDEEKIQHMVTALQARSGLVSEINPNIFIESLQPEKLTTINGLDDVELELFRHYAQEENVLFTTVPRGERHMLILPSQEEQKARQALLHTGWALTGREGARIRQQVEYRLKGRSAISISAEEGLRELYIVSRRQPDHFVRISSEDYQVYKQNKQVATVSRAANSFETRCMAACDSLYEPVVMTRDQFEELDEEHLASMPSIDLFPTYFDDLVEMNIQNRLQALVAHKMALDDEGNADFGITDPSMSYSEFAQYEFIADEEERQGRELEFEHFKQAALYSRDRYQTEEITRDGHSLDYIITRAEAKKRDILGKEFEPQRNNDSPGKPVSHGTERYE